MMPAVRLILMLVIFGLAAGNLAVWWVRSRPASAVPATPLERWAALEPARRRALVQRQQELVSRRDGGAVVQRALAFTRMSAEQRQILRDLRALVRETIATQSPAQRQDLLRMVPGARARAVYDAARTADPARLSDLAARLTRAADPTSAPPD